MKKSKRLEKANIIIQTSTTSGYSDGELIVHTLLNGRSLNKLSVEELRALAKGYNWWGRHDEAFRAIHTAIEKTPNNIDLLSEALIHIGNAHSNTDSLLEAYEDFIRRQIGPSSFWHTVKAFEYERIATGEAELEDYEWYAGDDILHPEALEQAIDELMKMLKDGDPQTKANVKNYANEREALHQSPRFAELMAHD